VGDSIEMTPEQESTRVGFRDIYRAVTESEVRVTAAIERAVSPLNASVSDHEIRIRALEAGASGTPAANKAAIGVLTSEIAALQDTHKAALAVSARRASDFSVAQKTLVTIIIVSNFILGLVVMFTSLITAQ
jgi:hypothetical protein